MGIEAFLEQYLTVYYFLLIFCVGISTFFNQTKNRRISQTKLVKFYIIYIIISTALLYTWFSFADLPESSYQDSVMTMLIVALSEWFANKYAKYTLWVLGIGTLAKTIFKLGKSFINSETNNSYIPSYATKNSVAQMQTEKKKRNFLMKLFYNENETVNEYGVLIGKISKCIAISLMIVFISLPIFAHFDIYLMSSKVGLLLFVMLFWELYYALQNEPVIDKTDKRHLKIKEPNIFQTSLKKLIILNELEILDEKSIGKRDVNTSGPSALICEVPNISELKELNIKVMNGAFFENKKVLVVCLNEKTAIEYHKRMTAFNREYDGKLVLKLITNDDKLFDSSVDIFVTAIENCFGNIKLLSEIDTIIIEDYDEMLLNKLELLRALGSIVKMGNPEMSYIILTYMLQGIEATIKSLLLINDVSYYCPTNKYNSKKIAINVWDKNDNFVTEAVFGKATQNLGSMVPLSLLSIKWHPERIILISKNEPLEYEFNELNAMRTLAERNVDNIEVKLLSEKAKITSKERYFSNIKKNWIITDDKSNVYEKIYKLSLINGISNNLNIVSEQYLLRDYMTDTYLENRPRLKTFLPYVPYEINSGKVILYNLLLQLTNFGVKENIIVNILNENGIPVKAGKGNNVKLIADKINSFIKQEFDIDVDLYSYITIQELKDKYVFDVSRKQYIEEEKNYILDEMALRLFPNEIFSRVSFVKDGFTLDIEKEYAYNFYQKYLPGQKHYLNGSVYEIKNTIETEEGINAIVEASTNYDNHTYRQDRKVDIISPFVPTETRLNKYAKVALICQMGKMNYKIKTDGYFEFKNGISKMPGEYRYVGLDEKTVLKTVRNHINADALRLEFELSNEIKNSIHKSEIEEIGEKMAFLLSELLVSLLGDNASYIQVKSVKDVASNVIVGETWVAPIEELGYINNNIEIYILEDTQIERGLIDMIYKNLDNILKLLHEYLSWVFEPVKNSNTTLERTKFLKGIDPTEISIKRCKKIHEILKNVIIK